MNFEEILCENKEAHGRYVIYILCVCHFTRVHVILHVQYFCIVRVLSSRKVNMCTIGWNTMSSAYVVDIDDKNGIISLFVCFLFSMSVTMTGTDDDHVTPNIIKRCTTSVRKTRRVERKLKKKRRSCWCLLPSHNFHPFTDSANDAETISKHQK